MTISANVLDTILAAAALYLLGVFIVKHVPILSRYCIPAPLVGGMAIDFVNIFVVSALIPVLGAFA